jgi:threonine/homoserine/homoserine lactone efflux protein
MIPAAMAGKKVFGNLFAAAVAILLIICALILAYDGWKAFKKYKAGAGTEPAEAEKAPA